MKRVFLKDIARDLSVSKTAVSLVLNNKGDENKISQETQKRIIAYAKKHNYVPNQLARALSRGKTETIGLIIPNISDAFYAKMAGCVEQRAMELGYTVIFSSSKERPEKETGLIRAMLNRQVDGLIIASTQKNREDMVKLQQLKFPFVLVDRHYPDLKTNYVVADNFEGTKKMTQHLIKNGRTRIGLVSIESGLDAMQQRRLGYEHALSIAGHKAPGNYIKELNAENHAQEMGQAILDMVKGQDSVDAIMFTTHYLAASGLRELKALGVKVPTEVAIISFDELGAFDLVSPPITASKQPVELMGNTAVELVVHEIEKKTAAPKGQRRLETQLMVRKSCGS
ncbi:LacI family DNA-binding transcriptional regulator [Maribacter sp. 2307ULW6-5]|uniref:LacI family DNA-binding transcriptional regulator n=1 Tax=Maribacter sp. 2307ULW6-5 TaxID=3386275 RepID=UPI0039BCF6D9